MAAFESIEKGAIVCWMTPNASSAVNDGAHWQTRTERFVFALYVNTSSMPIDPVVAFLIDVVGGRDNDIVSETLL